MRIFGGPRVYNNSQKERARLRKGYEWTQTGPAAWIQTKKEKGEGGPPPNFEANEFQQRAPETPQLVQKRPVSVSEAMARWEASKEREG